METKKSYSEQLKDPRWQKKRLEIMDRDGFKCKICNCETESLNVHHITYDNNKKPFEYDNNRLITVCEFCHKSIHENPDSIVVIQDGALNPFDYIQQNPHSLFQFALIENHKGDWTIEFQKFHGYFMDRIELISSLCFFIKGCDNNIRFSYDDSFNLFTYIYPIK